MAAVSPSPIPLTLLIGLPGSGKSTWAAKLQQEGPDRILISTDAIRAQLFGDEAIQGPWVLIQQELQRQMQQAVQAIRQEQAKDAIYDATHAVRRQRRQAIAQARAIGFTQINGIWLDPPLQVCLDRNQRRDRQVPDVIIQRMYRRLTGAPPSLNDGFDRLVHYIAFS